MQSELRKYQYWISKGLILCAWGDFLLCMETDPKYGSELWFLAGLVSFLIGHIMFIMGMRGRLHDHTSRGIKVTNNWAAPLIVLFAVTMAGIICPNVDDPVLQVGVAAYAVVIGTMAYHSLILSNVEQNLKDIVFEAKEKISDKKEFTYVFFNAIYDNDTGSVCGIRMHVIGSILFLISDSILGYSQFVEKQ